MSTIDCIKHEGVVESVSAKTIFVRIVSQSACANCHSKGNCASAESTEKIVEVSSFVGTYSVGDRVIVTLNQALGFKAILIGYFYPFLIMVATLVTIVKVTGNELKAGIASLTLLALYFLGLKLFRPRLEKAFHFEIEKV